LLNAETGEQKNLCLRKSFGGTLEKRILQVG